MKARFVVKSIVANLVCTTHLRLGVANVTLDDHSAIKLSFKYVPVLREMGDDLTTIFAKANRKAGEDAGTKHTPRKSHATS